MQKSLFYLFTPQDSIGFKGEFFDRMSALNIGLCLAKILRSCWWKGFARKYPLSIPPKTCMTFLSSRMRLSPSSTVWKTVSLLWLMTRSQNSA